MKLNIFTKSMIGMGLVCSGVFRSASIGNGSME